MLKKPVIVLLLLLSGCVLPLPKAVTFEDPNLEELIRQALDKPTGDIMDVEMAALSELHLRTCTEVPCGTLPLTGIEFCTNLQSLICEFDVLGMTDEQVHARLDELSDLTSLRSLSVTGPVAVGGCSLGNYGVVGTSADISPLASLTNLEYLMLFVQPSSLLPLESLNSLDTLVSPAATAEEVAEVAALTRVTTLILPSLWWNDPNQLAPLAAMTDLRDLTIERVTPALDTQDLTPIPQVLTLQVCLAGGSGQTAAADFVTAFPELHELTLGRVCFVENYCLFSDYSALGQLSSLERLVFHRPSAVDLSFVSTLDNLAELSFLEGDESLFGAGGQDFFSLVSALTDSPRPFTLVIEGSTLSSAACSEQIPALLNMPSVTLQAALNHCLNGI